MKHIYALIIKYVIVTIILEIVLSLMSNLSFGDIMYLSIIVTVFSYVVGDVFILSASNNTVATLSNIGLSLIIIYAYSFIWVTAQISFLDALISAVILGVGEWFFHRYIFRSVLRKQVKE